MTRDHIAGVTISVVQNGQVVLKKGYGFASLGQRKAVDPDKTLFRVASISKTFTWIALMNEIESGRMRLDGPVNLYLPEPLQLKDQGKKTQVRLRDLMTHTGRVRGPGPGSAVRARPQPRAPAGRLSAPGASAPGARAGPAAQLFQLRRGPGRGGAVANVTGKPFEQVVTDEIILPAGMAHTTFREARPWRDNLPAPMNETLAADLSDGFSWTPMGWKTQPREFMGQVAPAGSASSTAGDMARYMTLLLNGGTIDGKTSSRPRPPCLPHADVPPRAEGARAGTPASRTSPCPAAAAASATAARPCGSTPTW
jgi:CubicO group peptidase (beta-lactamase class C family)